MRRINLDLLVSKYDNNEDLLHSQAIQKQLESLFQTGTKTFKLLLFSSSPTVIGPMNFNIVVIAVVVAVVVVASVVD